MKETLERLFLQVQKPSQHALAQAAVKPAVQLRRKAQPFPAESQVG